MSNKRKGHGSSASKNTDWFKLLDDLDIDRKLVQEFFELVKRQDKTIIDDDGDNKPPSGLSIIQCCLLFLRWLQTAMTTKIMDETYGQADSTLVLVFPWICKRLNLFFEKWLSKRSTERRLEWARKDEDVHSGFKSITAIL